MGSIPTQRTLDAIREQGFYADIAERFNAHCPPRGKHFDLFGFIDIVALCTRPHPHRMRYGIGIVGIQTCAGSGGDMAKRLAKIRADGVRERAHAWLECGGRIEVWGWAKRVRKTTSRRAKSPTRTTYELRRWIVTRGVLDGDELYQTDDSRLDCLVP